MSVRHITSAFLAALITFGLFYLMQVLILGKDFKLGDESVGILKGDRPDRPALCTGGLFRPIGLARQPARSGTSVAAHVSGGSESFGSVKKVHPAPALHFPN